MSEEEDTGSELCPICDQWCGTEAAKQIAEWEVSIIQKLDELEELRKYKAEREKMSEEKITGVCVDIPTIIKEEKRRCLYKEAVAAANVAFPFSCHWSTPQAREEDLKREGYIQAYLDLHNEK